MLTDLDRNTLIENRESAICLIFTVNLTFMTGFLSNDAIFFFSHFPSSSLWLLQVNSHHEKWLLIGTYQYAVKSNTDEDE